MKKFLFLFCVFLFTPLYVNAQVDLGAFEIENYVVDIELQSDRTAHVRESLDVQFFESRHGIYRTIPFRYTSDSGLNFNLDITDISVTDGSNPYITNVSRQGYDKVIRIGDPDRYVSGLVPYVIDYNVSDVIRFFDEGSEFYWNIIGNNWDANINTAVAHIRIPEGVAFRPSRDILCFTGSFGEASQDCSIDYQDGLLTVESLQPLRPYEGLTVAIRFDGGFIAPTRAEIISKILKDNMGIPFGLILSIIILILWFKYGKEIDLGKPLIAEYEPPQNLSPGEVGYMYKEGYSTAFFAADIVDMAVKGHLKIEEVERRKLIGKKKDYKLILLPKPRKTKKTLLSTHQEELLRALFANKTEILISDLKNKFYKKSHKVTEAVEDSILKAQWFYMNPGVIKVLVIIPSVAVFFGSFFLIGWRNDFFVGLAIAGITGFVTGLFMSKKTREGAVVYHHILGLKEYIYTAERYRVKFQEDKHIFEQVLPYAMIFGMADKWAKAFEGILDEPPQWYSGTNPNFVPAAFASSMESFAKSSGSTFTSQPGNSSSSGFSGGGFSGGGFSGGGGGSW